MVQVHYFASKILIASGITTSAKYTEKSIGKEALLPVKKSCALKLCNYKCKKRNKKNSKLDTKKGKIRPLPTSPKSIFQEKKWNNRIITNNNNNNIITITTKWRVVTRQERNESISNGTHGRRKKERRWKQGGRKRLKDQCSSCNANECLCKIIIAYSKRRLYYTGNNKKPIYHTNQSSFWWISSKRVTTCSN